MAKAKEDVGMAIGARQATVKDGEGEGVTNLEKGGAGLRHARGQDGKLLDLGGGVSRRR